MHELCYATSKHPTRGFDYRGVIVSNNDLHIDTYKPADKPMYYGGNNHGGMVEANGQWYIFYHRHTNGTSFSRQGCIEPITILEDGSIPQVEITTSGPNGGPLTVPANIRPISLATCLRIRMRNIAGRTARGWTDDSRRSPKTAVTGMKNSATSPICKIPLRQVSNISNAKSETRED